MSSIFYFFRESLTGFTRNLSTTLGSIITIFLSLLIIGIFCVGGAVVNNVVSSVENQVSITCYVADEAEQDQIDEVMDYIRNLPDVQNVSFTTKDQALEDFSSTTSNSNIVDQLDGQNPLPASIEVELQDAQQVETIAQEIASYAPFQEICDEDDPADAANSLEYGQQTVDRLFQLTNAVRIIGIVLVALLIFIAFIFINNTIRLAILARRREIAIMRLVGASNGFIRGPFLAEGALHALIGAALAIGIMEVLRNIVLPRITAALPWLPLQIDLSLFLLIYAALVVAGLLIGLFGSLLAMRRYLKV